MSRVSDLGTIIIIVNDVNQIARNQNRTLVKWHQLGRAAHVTSEK